MNPKAFDVALVPLPLHEGRMALEVEFVNGFDGRHSG